MCSCSVYSRAIPDPSRHSTARSASPGRLEIDEPVDPGASSSSERRAPGGQPDGARRRYAPRMLKVYGFGRVNKGAHGNTRDVRVLWALEEMGLPFEIVGMDHPNHDLDSSS